MEIMRQWANAPELLGYDRGSQPVLPGAPRPLQENKINKNWMKLKNKKQKVESK